MANKLLYGNNAASTLLSSVLPTDVFFVLPNGNGAKFPNPQAGQSFFLTVEDTLGNVEIVEVTARTNDTLTVTRGRDGTAARAFSAGTLLEMRVTSAVLSYLDYQAHAGQANGSVVLDENAKVPVGVLDTPVKAIADPLYNVKLGFTPVQQGGGTGMASDKVYMGYRSGTADFAVQRGTDAPYRVIVRAPSADGKTVLSSDRFYAYTSGVADVLKMGASTYEFVCDDDSCVVRTADGARFGYRYSTKQFDVIGKITQNNVGVSLVGHTHAITDIVDLSNQLGYRISTGSDATLNSLYVSGQLSAATVIDRSDERLKTNIYTMHPEDAESMIRRFRPVRYHDKQTDADTFGLIAQEVQVVAPQITPEDSYGMLGVQYQRIVAPLIAVVQKLLAERDQVQARLNALEGK